MPNVCEFSSSAVALQSETFGWWIVELHLQTCKKSYKTHSFNRNKTNLKTSFKSQDGNNSILSSTKTYQLNFGFQVNSSFNNLLLNKKKKCLFVEDFLIFIHTSQWLLSFILIHLKLQLISLFHLFLYSEMIILPKMYFHYDMFEISCSCFLLYFYSLFNFDRFIRYLGRSNRVY